MTAMLDIRMSTPTTATFMRSRASRSTVQQGEIVTLIGSNGAGKTTTLQDDLRACFIPPPADHSERQPISDMPAHKIVEMGVVQSPEGRRVFPRMTVLENLEMGAFSKRKVDPADLERVFGFSRA